MKKNRLNILFITQEYSPTRSGGAGVYAYELVRALVRKNDVEVHVLAPGISSRDIPLENGSMLHERRTFFHPLVQVPSFHRQVARNAARLIADYGIHTIHSNNNAGLWTMGLLPAVATIHHPVAAEQRFTTARQRLINLPDVWMEKETMRRADLISVPSHFVRDLLVEKDEGLAPKLRITPNGLDAGLFNPVEAISLREKLGIAAGTALIFFPGGERARRKGAINLIRALRRLDTGTDYRILMSGKSREAGWEQTLERTLALSGLGSKFIRMGEIAYDRLPLCYAASDFVVYPSLFEGFGLPVLEAMACGKAIIASRTGEAPYIIEDGISGILVDADAPADRLARDIDTLMRDAGKREALGERAHSAVAERFSWAAAAADILEMHRSLL